MTLIVSTVATRPGRGGCYKTSFFRSATFPILSPWPNTAWLPIQYHVRIWRVSLQPWWRHQIDWLIDSFIYQSGACPEKQCLSSWDHLHGWTDTVMTDIHGNIFRVTGPLWGESTSYRWIPVTKSSDAELWCFLWSAPQQTFVQRIETLVIWDTIALIGSASGSRDFTRFGPGGSTLSRFPCKTPIGKVGTSQYTFVTKKLA